MVKQHFASYMRNTGRMSKKPINEVLASNLLHFMQSRGFTQSALGEKSGIGQTTVGLYLNPDRRKLGASGKPPSAKLSEVEMLADGLGVEVWELLRNLSSSERAAYEQIEKAFNAIRHETQEPLRFEKERTYASYEEPIKPERVRRKRTQPATTKRAA
jgi:transcriptional regulator with XRE-family HTH domain